VILMSPHQALFAFAALAAALALGGALYVALLAPVGLFAKPAAHSDRTDSISHTRFVMLIPAHDEEEGISATLESVRLLKYPATLLRVIVIADNCSDRTAAVVRAHGFECRERVAPNAPGKGRALRWALDQLAAEPFDAAVFIDADTRVDPDFLSAMDRGIQEGAAALQGRYEFDVADSSYFSLISFASKRAENNLFWRPRQFFGWAGFIVGNGFCLRRETIQSVPWDAYSIVEDVEYSIQLALQGLQVRYLEAALVTSRPTRRVADAAPQRLRWASGTFQVILRYVPRLLRASIAQRSFLLAEMALALTLTSRFLLLYLLLAASGASLALGVSGGAFYLRAAVIASFLLLAIYTAMVFSQIPKKYGSPLKSLAALPFYVCWMLFVHLAAAVGLRRNSWVRTAR
jgi:cellulose synthase/poly-beta-1,6-N-acetylglucosamine synthase-like glycosyltransferase